MNVNIRVFTEIAMLNGKRSAHDDLNQTFYEQIHIFMNVNRQFKLHVNCYL